MGFAPAVNFPVGHAPFAVAVAEFNGDGKLDLVVANAGSDDVTILLGDGQGGFLEASGSPVSAGGGPFSVATADFNGDGKIDLAVANYDSGNVSIFLGDGRGGFNEAMDSPLAAGSNPASVAVGDFNGDGKTDLAVANHVSHNVTILLGNGDGSFNPAPGSPVVAGYFPAAVVVSDFNGDGRPDLAVANFTNSFNLTILLGDGSGRFTPTEGAGLDLGFFPDALAAGDFNGDGKSDLAVVTQAPGIVILLGDGTGGFSSIRFIPEALNIPFSVVIADVNGDGKPDLAVGNVGSTNVSILLGDGYGNFKAAVGSPFTVGDEPKAVAVGDFNSDGRPDLAVANIDSDNVTVLINSWHPNRPPVALARAWPLVRLGFPIPLVVSVNGSNAPVVLDGSLSSDPEMDPLNYFWASSFPFCDPSQTQIPPPWGGLFPPAPFASGVIVTQVFSLGPMGVELQVIDCLDAATTDVCFSVEPVCDILALFARVVDNAPLLRQDAKVLISNLTAACDAFSAGKINKAVNSLQNFQNKAQSHVSDPALATNWIQAAQGIIDGLLFQ